MKLLAHSILLLLFVAGANGVGLHDIAPAGQLSSSPHEATQTYRTDCGEDDDPLHESHHPRNSDCKQPRQTIQKLFTEAKLQENLHLRNASGNNHVAIAVVPQATKPSTLFPLQL